ADLRPGRVPRGPPRRPRVAGAAAPPGAAVAAPGVPHRGPHRRPPPPAGLGGAGRVREPARGRLAAGRLRLHPRLRLRGSDGQRLACWPLGGDGLSAARSPRPVHDRWPLALMRARAGAAPLEVEVVRPAGHEEVAALLRSGRLLDPMPRGSAVSGTLAP